MKKIILFILVMTVFASCGNSQKNVKDNINTESVKNIRNIYTINNVESCIESKYEYKFGEVDSLSVEKNETKYDEQGNLILEKHGEHIFIYYHYKDTLLMVEEQFFDTTLYDKRVFSYNNKNKLQSHISYGKDGKEYLRFTYNYHDNIVIDSIYFKGDLTDWSKTHKDISGRDSLIFSYHKYNDWKLEKDLYEYDSIGLNRHLHEDYLMRYETKRTDNNKYKQIFETWDLEFIARGVKFDKRLTDKEMYEYDSNMDLIKHTKEKVGEKTEEEIYKNGLIVEKRIFGKNRAPESISYYEYIK